MNLGSSPSYTFNSETSDTFTKSQEDHFFATYMRFSSSPDSNKTKIAKKPMSKEASLDESQGYEGYDELDQHGEIADDDLLVQVPLSSSPPDFTSSSPRSYSLGSQETGSCSTLTSMSSNVEPEANILDQRSLNVSNDELSDTSSVNEFTQKLHCRLLAVLEERRRPKASSLQNSSGSQDDFSSVRTGSFVSAPSDIDAAGSEVDELPAECNDQRINKGPGAEKNSSPIRLQNYRIIKRARSNISYESAEDSVEGPSKRQKIRNDDVSHTKPRIYAHRTASLRRADSLKIVCINATKAANYVKTVPATPVQTFKPDPSRNRLSKKNANKRVIENPVPIIAPPLGYSAGFPLNSEQLAKQRLFALLEREQDGRERDGLYLRICQGPDRTLSSNARGAAPESSHVCFTSEWETAIGLGRQDREEAVGWLLEIMPTASSRIDSRSTSVSQSASSASTSKSSGRSYDSSQSNSPCRSTSSIPASVNSGLTPSSCANLEDQLAHSPNTRFHAVWMLLRYFHLCSKIGKKNQPRNLSFLKRSSIESVKSNATDSEGLNLILWDVTVGCLSISIKFHRDFLDPLLPVFAHEYLTLAPHEMSYEDLETAHRDILSAFGYRLGVTPQLIMDEIWLALPSLRGLLHFDTGRECATSHTWTVLFTALDGEHFPLPGGVNLRSYDSFSLSSSLSSRTMPEPDVLRFSVSMLTVVALMEGIVYSLSLSKHRRWMKQRERNDDGRQPHLSGQALQGRFRKKAREESEGVLCDIQALTGITDAELRECRAWIRNFD